VVVRVLEVLLDDIVVNVLDAELSAKVGDGVKG